MSAKSSLRQVVEPAFVLRPVVVGLVLLTVALAGVGAAIGAFSSSAGAPTQATSVYGVEVILYGQGLFRYDTLMAGAGFRGSDFATLFVGVPLTLGALWWARRGSLRGALLLVGAMGYLLYATLSAAIGIMYNPLHLLYISAFSAAFYGT
ncbi:MAG: hypothetical protein ACRC1H_09655, partial [Caldilineaceae bacterium]